MDVLIIADPERALLKNIRKVAEENPYSLVDVKRMAGAGCMDNNTNEMRTCILPIDFKVVLSVDEQPIGMTWHLSVSRKAPYHPNPVMVQTIIDELGLGVVLEDCLRIWFEYNVHDFEGNKTTAINMVFKKRNNDGTITAENS